MQMGIYVEVFVNQYPPLEGGVAALGTVWCILLQSTQVFACLLGNLMLPGRAVRLPPAR